MGTPLFVRAALGVLFIFVSVGGRLLAAPETDSLGSGTYRGRILSDRFLRQQRLARPPDSAALSAESTAVQQDIGDIAIIDTSNGVVPHPNAFDLVGVSILIAPTAEGITVAPGSQSLNLDALNGGLPLTLGDDELAVQLAVGHQFGHVLHHSVVRANRVGREDVHIGQSAE